MIDTDKYEGHTPGPWSVRRGQRDTVLIESHSWGCSDCGDTGIYTYENTNGRELCFPKSVDPDPFVINDDEERGRPLCYCESCDLMHYAKKVDATQNDNDLELIAAAPDLLQALIDEQAEVKRLYGEPRMTIDEWNTKPEGPCVTVYMNGCEYVGCLRLYKNEDGEVIE